MVMPFFGYAGLAGVGVFEYIGGSMVVHLIV
jgi:hypothetical protein